VLIHGNMVTGDDFNTSGVAAFLEEKHRFIMPPRCLEWVDRAKPLPG
jgi:hypothetical protein